MARPLRIQYAGAVYHITVRENEKKHIFFSDEEHYHFLRLLAITVERYQWICYDYCLMDNHYHLVIETPLGNLSQGMKYLNGTYTQYVNWQNNRVGHLFQGRFKAILIEKESHLLEVCRYVVLNPVRAGICAEAGDYPWSSYRAHRNLVAAPAFLATNQVIPLFGDNKEQALLSYEKFVKDGKEHRPFDQVKGQIFLGSDAFIARFQDEGRKTRGISKKQTNVFRPHLEDLLVAPNGLKIAHENGFSTAEIASKMGVHQTTVARRLKLITN
jgi:putative transposase